jgi:hypothetical protein
MSLRLPPTLVLPDRGSGRCGTSRRGRGPQGRGRGPRAGERRKAEAGDPEPGRGRGVPVHQGPWHSNGRTYGQRNGLGRRGA